MAKIVSSVLEDRVRREVNAFLNNPSLSPDLRREFISNVIQGANAYLGFVTFVRISLDSDSLFKYIGQHVLASDDTYGFSRNRAIVQGVIYMNDLTREIQAKRFGDISGAEVCDINPETLCEVHKSYMRLINLFAELMIENDPDIGITGQDLNIGRIRPISPEDAVGN